ncbi:MAG: amidohydrolase family protein [Steroidobacteraceae bacterium]|nr:amidohydrolase family protein [Steroidobacteraceae bacterium]
MTGRVDSHQHFWRRERGDYTWLTPELGPIYRDYLPADLEPQLATAGVGSTILVQAAATACETRFMLSLANDNNFIAGVVGWVDFESPDAPVTIAELACDPQLVGLRPMIQDIPDIDWMLRDGLAPAFEAMIDHGLVFDALVRPAHLSALRELIARYPELAVVLDHGAKPPIAAEKSAAGDLADWKRGIATLARETPIVCKFSGLVTEAGSADAAVLAECAEHLLECFGPRRLMWGSDWPVCELVCSYTEWCRTTELLLAKLGPAERALIYSDTARATYGI